MRIISPKALYYIKLSLVSQFVILCLLTSCYRMSGEPTPQEWLGFVGATDERTALVGERVLRQSANAADAAAAMLLHQAVVLPSRGGLGGGGICQILDPENQQVKTLTFLPKKSSDKVGVPALPKGVFALQTRYGQLRWSDVVQPAYKAAKEGVAASALLKKDMELFPDNVLKDEGPQPLLSDTLQALMNNGTGTFYKGELGEAIVQEADGALNGQHYQTYTADWTDSIQVKVQDGIAYFPHTASVGRDAPDLWQWTYTNEAQDFDTMSDMPMFADQEIKGATVLAVDKSGMVVLCSVTQGSAFGSRQFSQAGGFYLSSPVSSLQDKLFSIIRTRPQALTMTYAMSLLSEHGLIEGVYMTQEVMKMGKSPAEAAQATKTVIPTSDTVTPILSCPQEETAQLEACQSQLVRRVVK